MKIFTTIITVFFLAIAPAPAMSQVLRCTSQMSSIQDDWLQNSVTKLKQEHPDIGFQGDDQPCQQAKSTVQALTRTLGRNYLKSIAGYEYVQVTNGEGYFTLERFKSKNPKNLQALATALEKNPSHKLKIESNIRYEYFLAGGSIVIMISSAIGQDENSKLFSQIRQTFSSPVSTEFKS